MSKDERIQRDRIDANRRSRMSGFVWALHSLSKVLTDSEDLKSISDVEGRTYPTESNGCQPKESHVRLCLGASQPQQSATDSEDLKSISDVEGRTYPTESNGCQPKESHVRLCLGASQPQQSAYGLRRSEVDQ